MRESLAMAQRSVDAAKELGADTFMRASDILGGNPRLALGFAAQIFNKTGIDRDLLCDVLTAYVNHTLGEDAVVAHLLPLHAHSNDLYRRQHDSLILTRLLQHARPHCFNDLLLTAPSAEEEESRLTQVLEAAASVGANTKEISAADVVVFKSVYLLGTIDFFF